MSTPVNASVNDFRIQFSRQLGAMALDVDIALPKRGITALFGRSGSGKTTILRAMAGLEHCYGSMIFRGVAWQDDKQGIFLKPEQRAIAYVFQEASLFPHMHVRANIEYGYKRIAPEKRRISFDEAVEWLGLEGLLERSVSGLSGGERQRVAIARALLTSPELLLMDEPLSALDGVSKREIMPYLQHLHAHLDIPVIYVSHSAEEVAQLADHVVQIEAGRVVAQGSATELLSSLHRPRVAGEEPGAVIEARVEAHDDKHHLSLLALDGGLQLLAPRLEAGSGEPVRVRIPAREVSISLNKPEGTSILNILPARIVDHSEGDPGRVLVQLDLEGSNARLLSRISRFSWDRLALKQGMVVQAQIKSMGLAR